MKLATPSARLLAAAALPLLVAPAAHGLPQKQRLVHDLAATELANTHHERLVAELDGWWYFVRDADGLGAELYRTQGTTASVELVRDIAPGPAGSRPDLLTPHAGELYFVADDGTHGFELWRTDGTAGGTQMVVDLLPGPGGSVDPDPETRAPMLSSGGLLWFAARDVLARPRLWTSDGTAGGTSLVPSLEPAMHVYRPQELVELAGVVYFGTDDSTNRGLWRATPAGASRLLPFHLAPRHTVVAGGQLLFSASETSGDRELWKSDGTAAGTARVADVNPGPGSSSPARLTALGSLVVFVADDGASGAEPWVSDGTAAGTQPLGDLAPGASGSVASPLNRWPMATFAGRAWFAADDGGGATPWSTDGTPAGTAPLVSGPGAPELAPLGALPPENVPGGTLYFAADDGATGAELWATDGTAAGTALVADLEPGPEPSTPRRLVADGAGGALVLATPPGGPTLHRTDGTAAGTALVASEVVSAHPVTGDSDPRGLHDLFGRVLVAADDGATGNEPWAAAGPDGPLEPLGDLAPGTGSSIASGDPEAPGPVALDAVVMGAHAYFFAYSGAQVLLHKTDGTQAGTSPLRAFDLVGGLYGYPLRAAVAGDVLVFDAFTEASGNALWRTDGTPQGTRLVRTFDGISYGHTRLGNEVLFFAWEGELKLWRTDGTTAGTTVAATFPPGAATLSAAEPVAGEGRIWFGLVDPATGEELWSSDGTAAGTGLVADVAPGPAGSEPDHLTPLGGLLYFRADDGVTGGELWSTDGTTAGTALVADLRPGPGGYEPRELTASGDRLFFAGEPDGSTLELRVLEDGDLTVLHPTGPVTTSPSLEELQGVTAVGSRRVFFGGRDTTYGRETWVSDGTPAGTRLWEDLRVGGDAWSQPAEHVLSDGHLFVAQDDGAEGVELRAAYVGATAQPLGVGCAASGLLPRLAADDPVLGATTQVALRGAQPATAVLVFLGTPATPTDLGDGCTLYLTPAPPLPLLAATTDAAGAWTSAPIAIPAEPTLQGLQLSLQAAVGPTATAPLGFDLSNGVLLTVDA